MNSKDVTAPAVTVNISVTWSVQLVTMSPSDKVPNPAGNDVRTSELAAPVPEPPALTNGKSKVPVRVPVSGPEVRGTVKLYIMSAIAFGTKSNPTSIIDSPARIRPTRAILSSLNLEAHAQCRGPVNLNANSVPQR